MVHTTGVLDSFCSDNCSIALQNVRATLSSVCEQEPPVNIFLTAEAFANSTTTQPATPSNSTTTPPTRLNPVLQLFGGLTFQNIIFTLQALHNFACFKTDSAVSFCFNSIIAETLTYTNTPLSGIENIEMKSVAEIPQLSCNHCASQLDAFMKENGAVVPSLQRVMQPAMEAWANTSRTCPADSLNFNQTAKDEGDVIRRKQAEERAAARKSGATGFVISSSSVWGLWTMVPLLALAAF
ncbi:hypothetical protein HDV05_001713 [Chytridiales sp. JEL 0842]|nr:hypothetical protein HDV05_001713 [Chytridiales sp. JEL 0842]